MKKFEHLKRNGELNIMNINDYRGTRDFVLVDHENATFYTGTTAAMTFDVRSVDNQYNFKRKTDLKREKEKLIARGYTQKYLNEL